MNEVNRSLQCPSWRVRDVLLYTAVVLGVSVCLLPNAWALQATPTTLSFQAIQGGTTPPSQSISISRSYNSHQTTWTASDNATWLTVSPGIGTMTNIAQFAVAVNATGLAAGTYIPSVTIKVGHRHRLIRPTQSEDEQKSSTVAPPTTTSPSTTPTTTTPSTTPATTTPSTTPTTTSTSTTASLSWSPPTNSTGVAGYNVYVGTASGVYGPAINVGNVTSYVVNNLVIGNTYYFVVTDYNTSGVESAPSNEVSKSIY